MKVQELTSNARPCKNKLSEPTLFTCHADPCATCKHGHELNSSCGICKQYIIEDEYRLFTEYVKLDYL